MDFDHYTVVLLTTPAELPELTDAEAMKLQDAHLNHLATLHDQGVLVAAGPLGDPASERAFRGLSILRCEPEEALRLKSEDPAVQAGVFEVTVLPWRLPSGAMHFTPTFFPRSIADVLGP